MCSLSHTAQESGTRDEVALLTSVDTAPDLHCQQCEAGTVFARLSTACTGDCCSGADADVSCPQLQLGSTRSAQIIYNLHTTAAYIYFSTINCSDNCKLICWPNLKFLKITNYPFVPDLFSRMKVDVEEFWSIFKNR